MSKEKFTQGEWKVANFSISSKGSGYVAKALPVYMDKSERLANAHLIAAAPDMYRMLEVISDRMHKTDHGSIEDILTIEKLLAKARGE